MLLVVNVTGKKYIVETEDELDFSPEMDESISRGNISGGYTLKFLEMFSEFKGGYLLNINKRNICTYFIRLLPKLGKTMGGRVSRSCI